MPRYIIERNIPNIAELTPEQHEESSRRAIQAANEIGVTWIKSYISESHGKIYCEYEALNPELLLDHARLAGLPADKISEIKMEISPDMFV